MKKGKPQRLKLPLYPFLSMLCEPFSYGRINGELIGCERGVLHGCYFSLLFNVRETVSR